MISGGALWELVRISRDCSREDIRNLAQRTLTSSPNFLAELRRLRIDYWQVERRDISYRYINFVLGWLKVCEGCDLMGEEIGLWSTKIGIFPGSTFPAVFLPREVFSWSILVYYLLLLICSFWLHKRMSNFADYMLYYMPCHGVSFVCVNWVWHYSGSFYWLPGLYIFLYRNK